MEAEVASRAATDGVTERTFSRVVAVGAVAVVVLGVSLSVLSRDAGMPAKVLGLLGSVSSGAALLGFGLLGRGFLVAPVWLLTLISALCTVRFDYSQAIDADLTTRLLRSALLGMAIVAAAVATQFASDRRFATPVSPGQVRISAFTLLGQIASAGLGLIALVATIPSTATVSYVWFIAGTLGLVGLSIAGVSGLRRR